MIFLKYLLAIVLVIALAACGGGGGSAGTTSGTGTSTTGTGSTTTTGTISPVSGPTVTLDLFDASGVVTTSVSASALVSAKATLKDASGNPIVGRKVTFSGDAALIKISPASGVLTDSSGVATVQLSAASLSAAGAGTLNAAALVGSITVTADKDFQLSPANLTLTDLNVGTAALAAYGNRAISVVARINGAVSVNIPVQVTFSASCGVVNPATATTDATGKAATTYTANNPTCAGTNVTITANSVGVSQAPTGTITVAAVLATNLQFVDATPTLIYLLGSGATTQAQVRFKVVDSTGNPVQNQQVNLSLVNAAPAAGLSIDTLGNSAQVAKTTDAAGLVAVAVFGGTVPTAVQVKAQLPAPLATVETTSAVLTVASGRAVQKYASLSLEKFSIDAFNTDGVTSKVTFSFADRQGNPVPDGTEVNFVSESGVMLPARCVVAGGTSQCTSVIRSSGTRPLNGRVSILSYVQGEEDFVDANFNNKYDPGESFTDLGNAYRDDDESGDFSVGEFSVPRTGNSTCTGGENGRPNTCDGVWGANEVRKEAVIVFATSQAMIATGPGFAGASPNYTGINLSISDLNDNSMATGTTLAAAKQSGSANCKVNGVLPVVIPNRFGAQPVEIDIESCQAGDRIRLTVTSTGGIQTLLSIALP